MAPKRKLSGEARRSAIVALLKTASGPVTGAELAEKTGVSRQVIVQDIALLKARNAPIVATPQGYLWLEAPNPPLVTRVVACRHTPDETERELLLLVDHGVKVVDVIVEHPIYGELRGTLMIQSREDVRRFIEKMRAERATLLSSLTGGLHLHTLQAPDPSRLDRACQALKEAGILVDALAGDDIPLGRL
ncbi:transcription repressor NadR [Calditerricola satsumensis]|uniref:Transcription repressor NadR n=1 Tax=Calditerricola satsumensis TaxID=373054 RepID=A0A8J3BDJ7_9BACI|nr:transcription repressor NadR [Calditerricola satsumensis]GGK00522.1 transcription repressor NadR [Calditerricola satsumensis]